MVGMGSQRGVSSVAPPGDPGQHPGRVSTTTRPTAISEQLLSIVWGALGWLGAVLVLNALGPRWMPSPADATVMMFAASYLIVCAYLAALYETFRFVVPEPTHGGLAYAAGFFVTNAVLDTPALLLAFQDPSRAGGLGVKQLESLATGIPLAYLAFFVVPLACERCHRHEGV
jgi:hypothetical protein